VAEARRPDTTFWVEPGAVRGDGLTLDREESRHLLRVHRAHPGTPFEAVDGEGGTFHCVLESAEDGLARGRVERVERDRGELRATIHLLVGIPEPGAAESLVEHAVPLGAGLLDFVACERSGRPALGPARLDRLIRLARSGVKQSKRSRLPVLRSSDSLASAVALAPPGTRLAADPGGGRLEIEANEAGQPAVTLAIGPPGGFSDPELGVLQGGGFRLISLGPNRLTSQTAAVTLLAVCRNALLDHRLWSI
jgi:16S rRNA (uracil1498-N3)-methyltransferase